MPSTPARTTPATFYVSRSSGNDDWTGRAAAPTPDGPDGPWKTLARASTDYIPGDRLLLKRGDTWNEELRPRGSGTPERPITVGAYGEGERPVIDRQDDRRDRIGIHLADQEGFRIVGLEFNRCMTGIYAEYSDGRPTKDYIWIEDCYFHDSRAYGDYKTYPNPRNIGLGICFFSWERDNRIVLKDITVKGCVFRRLASAVWTNSPDNFNKNASFVYNFGNMTLEDCLFEEGYQWQMGIRGVAGGRVRHCVTHDIGRGFRAWNGVAGAMFFRCKEWVFEDSEWGFISIGQGSGDGEAFDFEGNCNHMAMRRCLFHDTDGPGFLLCCYASDGHPNEGILMENCVLNGKSKRPIGLPRCEIINTTDWNQVLWKECRFYLSKGEALMKVMDPEKEKRTTFVACRKKKLADACSTTNLAARAQAAASSAEAGAPAAKAADGKAGTAWEPSGEGEAWLELRFRRPTAVNEFRIREAPSSSIVRYAIEYWDDGRSQWMSGFNGRGIGPAFVAPIVGRTTRKVRLRVMRTRSGPPAIAEFEAYNDGPGARPAPRRLPWPTR
ncbi:MAG: right-handed parallel beta-helix repeat-containing protein [Phycisphaerae bacterium]